MPYNYTKSICNPQEQGKTGHKLILAQPRPTRVGNANSSPRSNNHCEGLSFGMFGADGACAVSCVSIVQPTCAMSHESRLTIALRKLLNTQRVAALGTLGEDGHAFVSMVPFAIDSNNGNLTIHVSGLAPHAQNLERTPRVSLLVLQAEVVGEPVHALPRVTLDGVATVLEPQSQAWAAAKSAYLARFPEVNYMTELGDFRFVSISVTGARQVAGFGAARLIDTEELALVLRHPT